MPDNASFSNVSLSSSHCSDLVFTAFTLTLAALVFPLFAVVLCLGFWRWRHQRYTSHSDTFTYHAVVMEMFLACWCLFCCFGSSSDASLAVMYGDNVFFTVWSTKTHFHTLTCVEQHLAVVHPVTYLRLKQAGGVRIRNLSVLCVWLCFAGGIPAALTSDAVSMVVYYTLLSFALLVVSFCCASVLCVLRRPGPGRHRADPRRRRAFLTILAILAALLLSLGGMVLGGALSDALRTGPDQCGGASEVWFSLPGSVVLPLLYLHRAGPLPGCRRVSEPA